MRSAATATRTIWRRRARYRSTSIYPRLRAGTIIGWAENLPIQYQSNEVPNVAEVKTRQDYYQIDWPVITRQRQVGVYAEEVLAVYAPFAMGVITNIGNG